MWFQYFIDITVALGQGKVQARTCPRAKVRNIRVRMCSVDIHKEGENKSSTSECISSTSDVSQPCPAVGRDLPPLVLDNLPPPLPPAGPDDLPPPLPPKGRATGEPLPPLYPRRPPGGGESGPRFMGEVSRQVVRERRFFF